MDILIKNGLVLDPVSNTKRMGDVFIKDGVFSPLQESYDPLTEQIDATGCIVTPGLIDAHIHVFSSTPPYGTSADLLCPPSGVTTVIDPGSAGLYNMDLFMHTAAAYSTVSVKALLQPSMYGIQPPPYGEIQNPMYLRDGLIDELFSRHKDKLVGFKVRTGGGLSYGFGLSALSKTKEAQRALNNKGIRCNTTVHFGPLDEGVTLERMLSLLAPGDVFTHVFRGDSTIFGSDGKILPCVLEARKRGVFFDTAAARVNMTINCAKQALSLGFFPDIISTDIVRVAQYKSRMGSLIYQASLFLNMGMELFDVIRAVTYTPARAYGITNEAGTLNIGAPGDVAVIKIQPHEFTFTDAYGGTVKAEKMLVPQLTVKNGYIIYRDALFY